MEKKTFEVVKLEIVLLQDDMVRTSSESLGEDTGAWLEGWGGKK
jgi:hypothetical protein